MLDSLTIKEWQLIYFLITMTFTLFNTLVLLSCVRVVDKLFHESELLKLIKKQT